MAVAFDAKAPSHTEATAGWATATAATWTHTPVGTPRGVIVAVIQSGSGDQVSTVTYGGVALSRIRMDTRTTTEAGQTYLYHVGTGIPTGAQTVSVTSTGTAPKYAVSYTFTAATTETVIDSHNGADLGIIANPSVTVTFTGTLASWAGVAAHFYGGAAPVTTGLQAGETYANGPDFGAAAGMSYYRTGGASAASTTFGYTTLTSDDELISAAVIVEFTPPSENPPPEIVMARVRV